MGRGDMPSEPGDSWFSPKCIEVQPRGHRRSGSALLGRGAVEATDPRQTPNGPASAAGVRRRGLSFVVETGTTETAG